MANNEDPVICSNSVYSETSTPIRVVRIIARLNIGGPAIHVILLSQYLRKRGYETTLVYGQETEHEGNMLHLAEERGIEALRIPALGRELNLFKDIYTLWKLYRLIRKHRPHVVHTHTAKAGTLGRLAAILARVPVIIHTFHGHVFSGYFSDRRTNFFLNIERYLARHSTRIIAVSDKCRQDLVERGIGLNGQLITIRLGLELDRFPSDTLRFRGLLRKRYRIADSSPIVAIVARLVPIKRHDVFLRAVAQVKDEFPTARFLIVGDGETKSELLRLSQELRIGPEVIWTGFIQDPAEVYADSDIVALTSDDEGLPVAVIEALASGRIVVATNVGGVPELVEDGISGFLAERGNADDFARALRLALSDIDRCRKMGQSAQARILQSISIQRLVNDIDHLYKQCLEDTLV